MAAEGMPFPRRWNGGTISTVLDVIWGMSVKVAFAKGMGVEAGRATTAEEFNDQFARGLASPGPYVIKAVI